MTEEKTPEIAKPAEKNAAEKHSKDEVALELMKFIAGTTGYGKGIPTAGFGGKSASRTPEEYAESLLELFHRCREAVSKPLPGTE